MSYEKQLLAICKWSVHPNSLHITYEDLMVPKYREENRQWDHLAFLSKKCVDENTVGDSARPSES